MKKYKINGIIVEGNTCLDAISKIKDDITSDIPYLLNMAKDYAGHSDWQRVANICYSIVDKLKRAKLADSINSDDLDYLIEEEYRAVEDYRKAIENTTNSKLLRLYQHILEEELEHIRELQEAKKVDNLTKDDDLVDKYQQIVDKTIELFGRFGAGLYDELDEKGLWVDDRNNKYIVKRK